MNPGGVADIDTSLTHVSDSNQTSPTDQENERSAADVASYGTPISPVSPKSDRWADRDDEDDEQWYKTLDFTSLGAAEVVGTSARSTSEQVAATGTSSMNPASPQDDRPMNQNEDTPGTQHEADTGSTRSTVQSEFEWDSDSDSDNEEGDKQHRRAEEGPDVAQEQQASTSRCSHSSSFDAWTDPQNPAACPRYQGYTPEHLYSSYVRIDAPDQRRYSLRQRDIKKRGLRTETTEERRMQMREMMVRKYNHDSSPTRASHLRTSMFPDDMEDQPEAPISPISSGRSRPSRSPVSPIDQSFAAISMVRILLREMIDPRTMKSRKTP